MDLDNAQLAALDAAVREGTFEAAARRLNITPSAVSQRIRALETSVGRVLLTRTKPTAVTESGRVLLRMARQLAVLTDDVVRELGGETAGAGAAGGPDGDPAVGAPRIRVPLAVNADTLATWLLPALAGLAATIDFEFHREDESHTTSLLRDGTVMAAVSAVAEPVQGCTSVGLGVMRYAPVASPKFVERWFPELGRGSRRVSMESLRRAPVVVFDRRDELQHDYLRRRSPSAVPEPPKQLVPASADFVRAVVAGYGWGMVPEAQRADHDGVARGAGTRAADSGRAGDEPVSGPGLDLDLDLDLVEIDPGAFIDVPLYWQQWQLRTTTLDLVAATVAAAAQEALRPLRPARS